MSELLTKLDAWKLAETHVESALEAMQAALREGDHAAPYFSSLKAESLASYQLAHALFLDFMQETSDSAVKAASGEGRS